MIHILDRIRRTFRGHSVDIVAPADIRELPEDMRKSFTHALIIGVALDPVVIAAILDGPTREYCEEYRRANRLLSRLAGLAAGLLRGAGHDAESIEPTTQDFDTTTLRTRFPHKAAATRAGIGWIGKNDLLVTREFGSALRFATVLTDADLGPSEPVNRSSCGTCTACLDICPAKAPSGRSWEVSLDRDEFFDVQACYRTARRFDEERGFGASICGMCIAACPWTKIYLAREGAVAP
jgi:epoxyqueuosine reductase QueG